MKIATLIHQISIEKYRTFHKVAREDLGVRD